jgi:hypothetical protein
MVSWYYAMIQQLASFLKILKIILTMKEIGTDLMVYHDIDDEISGTKFSRSVMCCRQVSVGLTT